MRVPSLLAFASIALIACQSQDTLNRQERAIRTTLSPAATHSPQDTSSPTSVPLLQPSLGSVEALNFSPEARAELEALSGPANALNTPLTLGQDLQGQAPQTAAIALDRVVLATVRHNLPAESARFGPAIAQEQLNAADAAFDWVLFADGQWNNLDRPTLIPLVGGFPVGSNAEQRQSLTTTTGVRRTTRDGGTLSVGQALSYLDDNSPGLDLSPDPSSDLAVSVRFDQPLLRGAGETVNTARVRLAANLRAAGILELERTLIDQVSDARRTYWDLAQARAEVLILQRVLDRGLQTRDQLRAREALDAQRAQIADATSRVEARRTDLLRAQASLRLASDRLKSIMNDPDLPLESETVLLAAEEPTHTPLQFSLSQSLTDALRQRPEVSAALLNLDDTAIRQNVALSNTLPRLDLSLGAAVNALEDDVGSAYGRLDGDFVDTLVGLTFEVPLGNRGPEADLRRARLERLRGVVEYKRTLRQVILDVRSALVTVSTSYALIEQTRAARLAAADTLRTLLIENDTTGSRTVERLDLELNRQEALARAERAEVAALADYQRALVTLDQATAGTLRRFNIELDIATTSHWLETSDSTFPPPPPSPPRP